MNAFAWAIGPLTFGAPVLLWGAAAAAAPILIHLMLRPRPRRQPFPAIRFILQSHAAAEKTNRLKRLLLLLMRMAAVVCIAALLAQPRLRTARWIPVGAGPISAAFCIDDSASMGYRSEGKTRVDAAKEWAESLVSDRGRFGEESEFAVLTSGPGAGKAPLAEAALTSSRAAVIRELDLLAPGNDDHPVGKMIRRADELLAKAKHPRREIYVFTDSTLRAWRDLTQPPLVTASKATVFCVDVGVAEDLNTSLTLSSAPKHPVPANAPIRLDVAVRAGKSWRGPIRPGIEVRVDDQPRLRCGLPASGNPATSGELLPGQTVNVPITLSGVPEGLRCIRIELSPSDPLPCDNVRYACVQAGQLPGVAVVNADEGADSAGTLLSAMLAPPALPDERQRMRLSHLTPAEMNTAALGGFRCVFLADVPSLEEPGWRNLTEYARGGGVVVTILGGAVAADRYGLGADLLPALPGEIADFATATHLAPTDLTHPLLEPFANPGVDSLADRGVMRAWTVRKIDDRTTVLCPLASGGPGLIEKPVGAGRSILLTFSPQREWSEFASQAAPMILLLHTIVATGSPGNDPVAYATAGATKTAAVPSETGPAVDIRVSNGGGDAQPVRVDATAADWRVAIPTGRPGCVTITATGAAPETLSVCAVNVADEESDLRRLRADQLVERFAPGLATTAQSFSELRQVQRRHRVGVDAAIPAGVLLLVLLFAESAFANRFYKRTATPRDGR